MEDAKHIELEKLITRLLVLIGEDPEREGLKKTPHRVAKWWTEFIEYDPGNTDATFESASTDQMVVVSGIKVWSLCEHHLLPFWAEVSVGYIPNKKVLGLSKFARVAHKAAHGLQIQERLVDDIASEIKKLTESKSIAVIARGEHLCMTMRGIKTPGLMTTSKMTGAFMEEPEARAEFLSLVLTP